MVVTAPKDHRSENRVVEHEAVAWVPAAVAGDPSASEALLTALLPRVRNLVRYLMRRDGDVDDVAQDALVAILRGLSGYRAEGPFEAWVDRVVARTALTALRARRRRPAVAADDLPEIALVPDPGAPPDEYTMRRRTVRLLDALPDEQREVLVLHHAVGLTVPEVAAEIGAPSETVRSRLRLAKARFRQLLADGGGSGEDGAP